MLTDELRYKYQDLWNNMVINNDLVKDHAKIILSSKERYEKVVKDTTIPWAFVGCVHYRESSCSFKRHPHEGSRLTDRTLNVPKGRPLKGEPPFTWEESARDCIFECKDLGEVKFWSLPVILYHFEMFNGFGYAKFHSKINSPYLWSGTNHYAKGKYFDDGIFDPDLVDRQMGCAPLFRFLTDKILGLV